MTRRNYNNQENFNSIDATCFRWFNVWLARLLREDVIGEIASLTFLFSESLWKVWYCRSVKHPLRTAHEHAQVFSWICLISLDIQVQTKVITICVQSWLITSLHCLYLNASITSWQLKLQATSDNYFKLKSMTQSSSINAMNTHMHIQLEGKMCFEK